MEDTGSVSLLVADHVGAPAQEGPEVHARVRSVGDDWAASAAGEAGAGEEGGGEGVVEGPGEGVCWRITLNTAAHSHSLILRHPEHYLLTIITYWSICNIIITVIVLSFLVFMFMKPFYIAFNN